MNNFTILSLDQIKGDKQLEVFKKYGIKAKINDFAALLGAYATQDINHYNGERFGNCWGKYWAKDIKVEQYDTTSYIITNEGYVDYVYPNDTGIGVRPVLTLDSYTLDVILNSTGKKENGIIKVKYGEFPQVVENLHEITIDRRYASIQYEKEACFKDWETFNLDNMYKIDALKPTGKSYINPIDNQELIEYECDGVRYIHLTIKPSNYSKYVQSEIERRYRGYESDVNRERYLKSYWLKVLPIEWLVDIETKMLIAEDILFTGVSFAETKDYKGDFETSNLNKFLNTSFANSIKLLPSLEANLSKENQLENIKGEINNKKLLRTPNK